MDVAVVGRAGWQRDQFGDLRLMRIAYHPFDAGHCGQFVGRALRVAAGHQDTRGGILAMHAADGLAHVVIGRPSDRAGVEDHQIGLAALPGGFQPLGGEQRFQRRAIGLGRAAAEVLNEEFPHVSSIIRGVIGKDSVRPEGRYLVHNVTLGWLLCDAVTAPIETARLTHEALGTVGGTMALIWTKPATEPPEVPA